QLVGVARKERQVAEGVLPLPVEDRRPGGAMVGRLPQPATGGGHVQHGRIARVHFHVVQPTAHHGRPDGAETEAVPGRLGGDGGQGARREGGGRHEGGRRRAQRGAEGRAHAGKLRPGRRPGKGARRALSAQRGWRGGVRSAHPGPLPQRRRAGRRAPMARGLLVPVGKAEQ
ncbi:MAG: hypothetical protein ACK56I_00435, partial [bacterium]